MEFENLMTLIQTVSDSKLTELRYEEGDVKIRLTKRRGKVQVVADPARQGAEKVEEDITLSSEEEKLPEGKIVESPLVGTFYAAPAEGAKPFVTAGDAVKKGQTLAIVEAMKLMNEIESDYDGIVAEIYVENGQAVEYGQPLFRIV